LALADVSAVILVQKWLTWNGYGENKKTAAVKVYVECCGGAAVGKSNVNEDTDGVCR